MDIILYTHRVRATDEVKALFLRDSEWINICNGRITFNYAITSVKNCTDIILITRQKTITSETTICTDDTMALSFLYDKSDHIYIDLLAAKSGYGSILMDIIIKIGRPLKLTAIDSAKWFYFDAAHFSFTLTKKQKKPALVNGCSLMYYIPNNHSDEDNYTKDLLLTKHLYLYMRILNSTGYKRSTYAKIFTETNNDIRSVFNNTVPNYVKINIRSVNKLK